MVSLSAKWSNVAKGFPGSDLAASDAWIRIALRERREGSSAYGLLHPIRPRHEIRQVGHIVLLPGPSLRHRRRKAALRGARHRGGDSGGVGHAFVVAQILEGIRSVGEDRRTPFKITKSTTD